MKVLETTEETCSHITVVYHITQMNRVILSRIVYDTGHVFRLTELKTDNADLSTIYYFGKSEHIQMTLVLTMSEIRENMTATYS